ncbi:MAG: hypothetical protein M3362_21020 [Acidobacteriota bacterium]|nr:hypothetical protein [Acidobacteriota bacterium]
MTLAQFQAAVQPSLDARQRIDLLEEELRQEQTNRDNADELSLTKVQQVVNGVLAEPGGRAGQRALPILRLHSKT